MGFYYSYRSTAVVAGEGQVGDTRVDSKTVIAVDNVITWDNDARGRADIKCIGVLCRIAGCWYSVKLQTWENGIFGTVHAEMGARSLNDLEATEMGVCGFDAQNARSIG